MNEASHGSLGWLQWHFLEKLYKIRKFKKIVLQEWAWDNHIWKSKQHLNNFFGTYKHIKHSFGKIILKNGGRVSDRFLHLYLLYIYQNFEYFYIKHLEVLKSGKELNTNA